MPNKNLKNEPLNPKLNPNSHSHNNPFLTIFLYKKEWKERKFRQQKNQKKLLLQK